MRVKTFDFAAVRELAALLAGREPQWVSEPYLAPGSIMWTRTMLPRVLVSPDVLSALNDAVAIGVAVRERTERAVGMALRREARVWA